MRTWVGFVKCMKWDWSENDDNCKRNDKFGLFTTWGGGVGLKSLCNTISFVCLFCFYPKQQKTNPIEKYNFGEKRRFLLEGVTFKVTAGHNKLSFIPYKGWWGEHLKYLVLRRCLWRGTVPHLIIYNYLHFWNTLNIYNYLHFLK